MFGYVFCKSPFCSESSTSKLLGLEEATVSLVQSPGSWAALSVARRNDVCGTGKARMINTSAVVTSKALSKHSHCLVLGTLSANILLATREIHFPWGALFSGCTPARG